MIKSIQVEIVVKERDFTPLEETLIELFVMNFGTFVNAFNLAKPMMMNPIEQSNADFSMEFLFQESIDEKIGSIMAEDIKKRLDVMFHMAEIDVTEIRSIPIHAE